MDKITGKTKVVGIIGYPITHSLSPVMHNAAFARLGLDFVYAPYEVKPESLGKAVQGLAAAGVVGFNVTIPHKERIFEFLDRIDPKAKELGAVNTVRVEQGRLVGYNTDAPGFLLSLKKSVDPYGKSVLVLGAGGSARAVVFSLLEAGISQLAIANRSLDRAQQLVDDIISVVPIKLISLPDSEINQTIRQADIIINATPVGLKPDDPPVISMEMIRPGQVVYDLVYNPPETQLLKQAKAKGAITQNGLEMLVYQGALAFELWTGQKPPIDIMQQALQSKL